MNRAATIGFLMLLSGNVASAGMINVPCEHPFVFRDAAVNVVVLPYTMSTGLKPTDEARNKTGQHLSLLVQMNALQSIVKFGNVAAEQFVDEQPGAQTKCLPELVWRSTAQQIGANNALVVLWGRIFEDENQIYLQTFVRFARAGVNEQFAVKTGSHVFNGALAAQSFAFPPQRISQNELQAVDEIVEESVQIRTEPRDDAPGMKVVPGIAKCFGCEVPPEPLAYVVTETKGEWAHIQSPARSGWIKLQTGIGSRPLAAKLPELDFVEGLVGYLELGVGRTMTSRVQIEKGADAALSRYLERAGSDAPVMAAAVGNEIRAVLAWQHDDRASAQVALDQLGRAEEMAPADGSIRNLRSIARLRLWSLGGDAVSQRDVASAFLSASLLDSSRNAALQNLGEFYRMALDEEASAAGPKMTQPLTREEIAPALQYIDKVLATKQAPPRAQ